MPVYVDDMCAPYRDMLMSHMIATTTSELLAMSAAIGVSARHIQRKGTPWEHFDICQEKKAIAIQLGAIEVTQRELVEMIQARKPVRRRRGEGKIIDVEHLNAIEA